MRLMISKAARDDVGGLVVKVVHLEDGWRIHVAWPDAVGHPGILGELFKTSAGARNAAARFAVAEATKDVDVVLVVDS